MNNIGIDAMQRIGELLEQVEEQKAIIERLSVDSVMLNDVIIVVEAWQLDVDDTEWSRVVLNKIATIIDEGGD